MLRSQRASIVTQPPLVEGLSRKRQRWLESVRVLRAPAWAGLNAALGFAARQAMRWRHFPALLQGEMSYPWPQASMTWFFPLLLQSGLAPTSLSRLPAGAPAWFFPLPPQPGLAVLGSARPPAGTASGMRRASRPLAVWRALPLRLRPWEGRQSRLDMPLLSGQVGMIAAQANDPLQPTRSWDNPVADLAPWSSALEPLSTRRERPGSLWAQPEGILGQAAPRPATALRLTSGTPLEPTLRARLEPLLGFDLGGVRLHTDSAAASLSFRLRAHAFAVGRHIFFAAGRFQPQTRQGLALLAHEIVHVGQQPNGVPWPSGRLAPIEHQALEREAHLQAQAVLARTGYSTFGVRATGPVPGGQNIGDLSGVAAVPGNGGTAFPPLVLSYASRTLAVVPLRQEMTAGLPEALTPAGAPRSGAPPGAPAPEAPDPEQFAQQVYTWLQRRQRLERERRGIQQWH